MIMTREQLAASLALQIKNSTVKPVLWRNPAAALGAVAHRTWRIDRVKSGTRLVIKMKNRPTDLKGARFWVGSTLGGWGTDTEKKWEDHFPLFPAGGWTPSDQDSHGTATITAPKSPFLVVLAMDTARNKASSRRRDLRAAVKAEKAGATRGRRPNQKGRSRSRA